MAWTVPSDPVGGTVITTSWAIVNVTNNLKWLRVMSGNGDPPGTDYVPVSTGPTATVWGKVTSTVMAIGAAIANIGYTPANKAGDAFTGAVSAPSFAATGGNVSATGNVSAGATGGVSAGTGGLTTTGNVASGAGGSVSAGTGGITCTRTDVNSIATLGGISAQSDIVSAGQVRGSSFGAIHSVGAIAADGALSTAATGPNSLQVAGGASIGAGLAVTGNGSFTGSVTGGQYVSNIGGGGAPPFVVTSTTLVDNLNVLLHNGARASPTPSAGTIPIADAAGKLDAWVTVGGGGGTVSPIPPGLIMFIPDAAIPAGFSFYTPLNGRILAGAGTAGVSNAQSFTVGVSYGTDWGHQHVTNTFGVTAGGTASGGPEDNTGGASASSGPFNVTTPGTSAASDSHNHSLNGVSFAVSVSGNATGNTTAAIWVPPLHALNAIRKT